MGLPKDLGTWGVIIGIIALVLAYPLSLLANITSPRLQNWWAARSRRSLAARIKVLESQLASSQMPGAEEMVRLILRFIVVILTFIWVSANVILLSLILIEFELSPPSHERMQVTVALFWAFLLFNGMAILTLKIMPRPYKLVLNHRILENLRLTIGKMKDKLAKLEKR